MGMCQNQDWTLDMCQYQMSNGTGSCPGSVWQIRLLEELVTPEMRINICSGNIRIVEKTHLPVGEALVAVSRLLGVGTSQVLSVTIQIQIQSKVLTSVMLIKVFRRETLNFILGTLIHSTKRSLFFFSSKNWPSTTYALNINPHHTRKVLRQQNLPKDRINTWIKQSDRTLLRETLSKPFPLSLFPSTSPIPARSVT